MQNINRESLNTFDSQKTNLDEHLMQQNNNPPPNTTQSSKRLNSLDVLRGLTMVGMILVDNQGPTPPWFLDHAEWNGLTPADLIFPSFLFIMGMAVPLSLNPITKKLSIRNLVRIILLFLIGVFLNLSARKFTFNHFRIVGILQRISLCYGLLVFVHVVTNYGQKSLRPLGVLFAAAATAIYLGFMLTFSNQEMGCPKQKNLTKECNFGAFVDQKILTQYHMIYPNDPQGLFTTLTAFLNAYAGYWFCLIMQDNKKNQRKILVIWLLFSMICGAISVPLLQVMFFCKKIWSISFVFCTVGVSGASLLVLTLIIDIMGKNSEKYQKIVGNIVAPFIWLGRNPLAIFVLMDGLAIVMIFYIIVDEKSAWYYFYHYAFKSWISDTQICSTVFAFFFVLLWTFVSWLLHRKGIFIRL